MSQAELLLQHITRVYGDQPVMRTSNVPQVFFVSTEFAEAAARLTKDVLGIETNGDDITSVRVAECARLACPIQVLSIEADEGEIAVAAIQHPGAVEIEVVTGWDGRLTAIGIYRPGSDFVRTLTRPGQKQHDAFSLLLFDTITLIALINTPNHVTAEEGGTRQTRRRLAREFGAVSRVVRWKVKGDQRRLTHGGSGETGVALHYRRGHYRRARPWFRNVERVRRPGDDAPQLYHWIEGTWCGDPAFGVVSHSYTPKISELLGGN